MRQLVSATLSAHITHMNGNNWGGTIHNGVLRARRDMPMHLVAKTAQATPMQFEALPALRTFYRATSGNVGVSNTAMKTTAIAVRPRNNSALVAQHFGTCFHVLRQRNSLEHMVRGSNVLWHLFDSNYT